MRTGILLASFIAATSAGAAPGSSDEGPRRILLREEMNESDCVSRIELFARTIEEGYTNWGGIYFFPFMGATPLHAYALYQDGKCLIVAR